MRTEDRYVSALILALFPPPLVLRGRAGVGAYFAILQNTPTLTLPPVYHRIMRDRHNLWRWAQFQSMMLFRPRRSNHGTGIMDLDISSDLRRAENFQIQSAPHASYVADCPCPSLGNAARSANGLGMRSAALEPGDLSERITRPIHDEPSNATRRLSLFSSGHAAAAQWHGSRASGQDRRWQTAGTSQSHQRSRRPVGTGRFTIEHRIQVARDLLGKSNARRGGHHPAGRLRKADGTPDDQTRRGLRVSSGRWTLRRELALRRLQASPSCAGESACQTRNRHRASLSVAASPPVDSTTGASRRPQRVWP